MQGVQLEDSFLFPCAWYRTTAPSLGSAGFSEAAAGVATGLRAIVRPFQDGGRTYHVCPFDPAS